MRGGSLFSGIGGLELGAAIAGLEVDWLWQVEIDPFCRDVLARHFPESDRSATDVTKATNLAPVDVICGGFPCQDISLAGTGAGLAGERSGLWWEFARIIREVGPRFVLVENVSALLTRGLGTVLGELASLGYDAEWDCVPASAVGAPHQRDRVWIIASARSLDRGRGRKTTNTDGERCELQRLGGLHERKSGRDVDRHGGTRLRGTRGALPDPQHPGLEDASRRRGYETGGGPVACGDGGQRGAPSWEADQGWIPESAIRGVDDGIPRRLDRSRLAALGNAVVPQAAAVAWRRIAEVAR